MALTAVVTSRFKLNGDVVNRKRVVNSFSNLGQNDIALGVSGNNDVGGQRIHARRNGPDVQVMDADNSSNGT